MNTELLYLYRDASNYKAWGSRVLSGFLTDLEVKEIFESLDAEYNFIPSAVGLPDLQGELQALDVNDNYAEDGTYEPYGDGGQDHVWHELVSIDDTRAAPDTAVTAREFLAGVRKYKDGWPEALTLAKKKLGCRARDRDGTPTP